MLTPSPEPHGIAVPTRGGPLADVPGGWARLRRRFQGDEAFRGGAKGGGSKAQTGGAEPGQKRLGKPISCAGFRAVQARHSGSRIALDNCRYRAQSCQPRSALAAPRAARQAPPSDADGRQIVGIHRLSGVGQAPANRAGRMSGAQAPQIIALDNCFANPDSPAARRPDSATSALRLYMSDSQGAIVP